MTAPTPFHVASTAQQMARFAPASDAVAFNKIAMVCMGVMAAASVSQVLHTLLRDLNKCHEERHGSRGHGK